MLHLYKEITQWDTPTAPNHVYIFEDKPGKRLANAIGYIKKGSEEPFWFSKPLALDLKDRKFIQVGDNSKVT
jgi:hypothetical protein